MLQLFITSRSVADQHLCHCCHLHSKRISFQRSTALMSRGALIFMRHTTASRNPLDNTQHTQETAIHAPFGFEPINCVVLVNCVVLCLLTVLFYVLLTFCSMFVNYVVLCVVNCVVLCVVNCVVNCVVLYLLTVLFYVC